MELACRIGVIAQSAAQVGELVRLVRGAGFTVAASMEAFSRAQPLPDADIWVVDLDLHQPEALALVETLDAEDKLVIFAGDLQAAPLATGDKPPLPSELRLQQQRRLAQKLNQWLQPAAPSAGRRANELWVLAASAGGPEAVMAFLQEIPQTLAGVAFVYAQHIDPSGFSHLLKAVKRNSSWQVAEVERAAKVLERHIYVVSPEYQVELLEGGTIARSRQIWSGKFKPSLNQVIAKVARVWGKRGGAIVFSGMGDDGADSSKLLRHRGGQIWVQSPASCAVDSMPVSVIARGCHHLEAEPRELARRFVQYQQHGQAR